MKKIQRMVWLTLCIMALGLFAMPSQAKAANETSGTIGTNGGIQWTYDADTKTLTMTGEAAFYYDSSPFKSICADVEKIVVKDCKIKGTARYLFRDLDKLVTVEFDNVDTSSVTGMLWMFAECDSLATVDLSGLDTGNVTDMSNMFAGCYNLTSLDMSQLDTGNVMNMESMFSGCGFEELDLSDLDTGNVTDMSNMFAGCYNLTSLDMSQLDTGKVTDMDSMFINCSNLAELDLSSFDTEKVTDMNCMFYNCSSLAELDLSSFDTSSLEHYSSILYGCSSLKKLNLSNFNFNNLADEPSGYLFGILTGCDSLEELDLSNCNTSELTNMYAMFAGCPNLTSLDLSSFDTGKVTYMASMFYGCSGLKELDLSGFDTGNVTVMAYMFSGCSALEKLNVNSFDTSKVLQVQGMFSKCTNLKSLDMSSFDLGKIEDSRSMLMDCTALELIKTPKKIKAGEYISLPYFFVDSEGNSTLMIIADNTEDTLRKAIYISEMTLNADNISLENNDEYQLVATVTPDNATNKAMNWESSDTAVATVDANGLVTAVGEGTATITATAKDGSGVSASCTVTVTSTMSDQEKQVRAFVSRMYTVALGRAAEADGLDFYTQRLIAGDSNGACIAESFLCSPEFLNKGYDDAQYVTVLYKTFFDREPAAEEVNYWVGKLASGQAKAFVLSGFVNSVEFDNLCSEYGISRGFMREDGKPLNPGIGRFAERLYTVVLERAGEKEGVEYWSLSIANGVCTPKDAAKSFFFSQEYVNKNTSDAQYITTLYHTFMDRAPEVGGVEYWQNVLNNGATREQILEGFADSAEFKGIMASFGL